MTFTELIKKIFMVEIIQGHMLTLKHLFSPAVTRQYPEEPRISAPGFRGLHALAKNADGEAKCVGCGLCAAMCPSQCINIYTSEGEDHKKVVDRYEIEVLRCLYCGYCVEACPYGAVVMTGHYEYSGYTREELYYNKERLLENWDKHMGGEKGIEYLDKFWMTKSKNFLKPAKKKDKEKDSE